MILFAGIAGPWDFLLKWIPTVGWPAVLILVWKGASLVADAKQNVKAAEAAVAEVKKLVEMNHECLAGQSDVSKVLLDRMTKVQQVVESRQAITHTPTPIVVDKGLEDALADGIKELSNLVRTQSQIHTREFDILQGLATDQATITANQNNITTGFQRVVEKLIGIMEHKG